ncbi:hypothetical protein ACQCSU_11365 [Pseudarthrobacter sp. O4]|uniref:hypothetical protein n=1 Tax=Pseudarthrobacter sp. O4 TaxID=3418417 RepID=UPI003CEDF81D
MADSFSDISEWIRKAAGWFRAEAKARTGAGSPTGSGDEWQLTLKLAPGQADEARAEPVINLSVESPAWRDAAEAVRTTVKWLVAAFAVVGALMFAKGFITTPKLSWNENGPQLISAGFLGLLGLVGIGVFLYKAVRMLRPTVYDLNDLDPQFAALVDVPGNGYLPEGITNLENFKEEFTRARHSVISARAQRDTARSQLKEAEESSPPNSDAVKKAKEELEWWQEVLAQVLRSFNTLKTVRARLLNKAEYWKAGTAFDNEGKVLVVAALVAAFGGIGYQLALATPDEPAKTANSSPAAPTVGELIRSDSASGRELWEQLGLSRCQAAQDAARIAVIVSSGDGSSQKPYVVSTIPTVTCPGQTFTVIDPVARVSLPVKRDIVYTPDATTSPSTAGTAR